MPSTHLPLSAAQIETFIADGVVRIDNAFPADLVAQCRTILWTLSGCDPANPATWTRPVVRLGDIPAAPFRAAANTPILHGAFDQLVGPGRWQPRGSLGTFPLRFPSADDPGDAGWHVDMSFGWEETDDFMAWRVNIESRGRALLMLFLFSEVGEADAPTRIRLGSHRQIARRLAPAGAAGLSLRELASDGFAATADCPQVLATGSPGTVYLCHPFLVHAAQPHRGREPRFMAQPALLPQGPLDLVNPASPVEVAIARALQ